MCRKIRVQTGSALGITLTAVVCFSRASGANVQSCGSFGRAVPSAHTRRCDDGPDNRPTTRVHACKGRSRTPDRRPRRLDRRPRSTSLSHGRQRPCTPRPRTQLAAVCHAQEPTDTRIRMHPYTLCQGLTLLSTRRTGPQVYCLRVTLGPPRLARTRPAPRTRHNKAATIRMTNPRGRTAKPR